MYIRDWEISGLFVGCDDDGNAEFVLKNRFFSGDTLELMQPGKPVYSFKVENMTDDNGEILDAARSAMMHIHLKFPFKVSEFSILRKEKAANPIKKS